MSQQAQHLQTSSICRRATVIAALKHPDGHFSSSINLCSLSNPFIVSMAMHDSRICIYICGTFCPSVFACCSIKAALQILREIMTNSRCFLYLPLSLTGLILVKVVHHISTRDTNPAGLFLILLYRFQNEYACPAYISPQAPRCLYLRFKHQCNVLPEFSFPFPRVFTSLFPFLTNFW